MNQVLSCPTCGNTVPLDPAQRPATFPFCCARCRLRDVGAWADGRYRLGARELHEDDLEGAE